MLHQSLLPRITASTFINRTKTTANAVAVRKLVSKEEKRKENSVYPNPNQLPDDEKSDGWHMHSV